MINWRDVRSPEELKECSEAILALPWEEKEPILREMSDYLEEIKRQKGMEVKILTSKSPSTRSRRVRAGRRKRRG